MRPTTLFALVLATLVVAALVVYALRLWRHIWRRDRGRAVQHAEARADQIHSLRVLAQSLLDGELNLTEGAIRLKVMLDHLQPDGRGAEQYPDIYALYAATADMPRGAARRAQPATETGRMDARREQLEVQYGGPVQTQARALLAAYPPSDEIRDKR